MEATCPTRDFRSGDVQSADQLAIQMRRRLEAGLGPLKISQACRAANIEVASSRLQVGERRHRAMLVPVRGGFRAVIDPDLMRAAKRDARSRRILRFALAHEIGHTFFYESGKPPTRERPADAAEEHFCHRFASSLLMPVDGDVKACSSPWELRKLAAHFDVPLKVAAWSVANASDAVSVLRLSRRPHPSRGGSDAMRVDWSASKHFIARDESFKSRLANLADGESGTETGNISLSGVTRHVDAAAQRIGEGMLVVLRESPAPVGEQLHLFD